MKFYDYLIKEKIYESDISLIYRAVNKFDQTPVIIKILNKEYPSIEEMSKYKYEFDLIKVLDVDGVIDMYEIVEYGNTLGLIIEDIDGISLKKISFEDISLLELLKLFIEIARILENIHESNVIHKDINPSNILWNYKENIVKIIDFGIARKFSTEVIAVESSGALEGTLAYISPEQSGRMNRNMDYRGDYYSLGATFYEILTGRTVFSDASDPMELIHNHIAVMPIPLNKIRRSIPNTVSEIVLKLLAKEPEDRYQSTSGLIHDFEVCLSYLKKNKEIEDFTIGKNDVTSQFIIPDKLYGRDKEVKYINDILNKAIIGNIECLFVSGDSGVGKSMLVNEIRKNISLGKGFFAATKIDQYRRSVPYSAISDIFRNIIKQILVGNNMEIDLLSAEINEKLGDRVAIISEIVPEIEEILGKHERKIYLTPEDGSHKVVSTFNDFLKLIATSMRPVVIFIDDLHWIDQASLDCFRVLVQSEVEHIYVIGTFRENEVEVTHPLSICMRKIEDAGTKINRISLKPLNENYVSEIVMDTLRCEFKESEKLTEEIMKKTNGNPFFVTHLLEYLNSENLLWFNKKSLKWCYSIDQIRNQNISDSIANLMSLKIVKLTNETQKNIELAAFLGNKFDLNLLSLISNKSIKEVWKLLSEAIDEGLIIPIDDSYKLINNNYDSNAYYKFCHDRLQEVAYNLAEEKELIHSRIGLLMLEQFNPEKLSKSIFDIANHLNIGIEKIDADMYLEIIRINYLAALKAKKTSSYDSAYNYCKYGIELINKEMLDRKSELSINIYKLMAETSYFTGNYEYMNECCTIVLDNSIEQSNRTEMFKIRINAAIARDNPIDAIDIAFVILKELGLKLPRNPNKLQVIKYLGLVNFQLSKFEKDEILELEFMTDKRTLAIMDILTTIASSTYLTAQNLFLIIGLVQVDLSLKFGRTDMTSNAFTLYAMILAGALKKYDKAYEYGEIALKLSKTNITKKFHSKVYLHLSNFIFHWKESKNETMERYLKSYESGIENGDTEYGAWAIFFYSTYAFFKGDSIDNLKLIFDSSRKTIIKLNQEKQLSYNRTFSRLILNLSNRILNEELFENEDEIKSSYEKQDDVSGLFYIYFCKGIQNIYNRNYVLATSCFELGKPYIDGVISTNSYALFYYYDSLARLLKHKENESFGKIKDLRTVESNQRKLRKWVELSPENYEHCYTLVEAEYYSLKGKIIEAEKTYEKAINLSEIRGYIHDEALASELTGDFYKKRNLAFISKNYLSKAIYLYERWGALGKRNALKVENRDILISNKKIERNSFENTETETQSTQSLDLVSIVKSTQALSKEVELDKLLKRFMKLIIENAGAQEGMIILEKNDEFFIEARWNLLGDKIEVLDSINIFKLDNKDMIPISLIKYAISEKNPVIINNAVENSLTKDEEYVKNKVSKSMLCVPIVLKGELRGLLYLENNLTTNAFKMEHVNILKIMTTQAAISLENVRLYSSLEEKVKERTIKLKVLTEKYQTLSIMDQLTNIYNRRKLDDVLLIEFNLTQRYNSVFSVMMLDIDYFKRINDTYGHNVGDEVLIKISNLLKSLIRKTDTLGRWGGEEFMIICPNINALSAEKLGEKLRRAIENEKMPFDGTITCSFGVSDSNGKKTEEELVKIADDALYEAKKMGRNKVVKK